MEYWEIIKLYTCIQQSIVLVAVVTRQWPNNFSQYYCYHRLIHFSWPYKGVVSKWPIDTFNMKFNYCIVWGVNSHCPWNNTWCLMGLVLALTFNIYCVNGVNSCFNETIKDFKFWKCVLMIFHLYSVHALFDFVKKFTSPRPHQHLVITTPLCDQLPFGDTHSPSAPPIEQWPMTLDYPLRWRPSVRMANTYPLQTPWGILWHSHKLSGRGECKYEYSMLYHTMKPVMTDNSLRHVIKKQLPLPL